MKESKYLDEMTELALKRAELKERLVLIELDMKQLGSKWGAAPGEDDGKPVETRNSEPETTDGPTLKKRRGRPPREENSTMECKTEVETEIVTDAQEAETPVVGSEPPDSPESPSEDPEVSMVLQCMPPGETLLEGDIIDWVLENTALCEDLTSELQKASRILMILARAKQAGLVEPGKSQQGKTWTRVKLAK